MEAKSLYTSLVDALGIQEGEVLFIASDSSNLARFFKSHGHPFSVDQFIEEIQRKIGDSGSLFIPAYTDYLQNGETFDYQKSKPSTGAISNRVQRRKDFQRSKDPIHSVFVWGKLQAEFLSLTEKMSFGPNSVFAFLHQKKANMLFIDVDFQDSFTFVHYFEFCEKVPYRKDYKWTFSLKNKDEINEIPYIFHSKRKGILTDLKPLQDFFAAQHKMQTQYWNGIRIYRLDLAESFVELQSYLKNGGKLHRFSVREFVRRWGRKIIKNKDF